MFFLSSFCFLPCAPATMVPQISYSKEYVDVHEEEVVGYVEQFVLAPLLLKQIAAQSSQIEKYL